MRVEKKDWATICVLDSNEIVGIINWLFAECGSMLHCDYERLRNKFDCTLLIRWLDECSKCMDQSIVSMNINQRVTINFHISEGRQRCNDCDDTLYYKSVTH
jgi:hypothetical protein